ncbi:hypothetical protein NBRC111894_2979 [Sporolactobacillus inulinus]|uniref:Uncharacterized protein n=1 Tax=Sporolactobacillus inulinus TaxID=2078 RepID=A0A4Y1ZE95_9BACL|nr:hypothetical protein NBRC111894_2979 [Sporolactobacillus inulinus]
MLLNLKKCRLKNFFAVETASNVRNYDINDIKMIYYIKNFFDY